MQLVSQCPLSQKTFTTPAELLLSSDSIYIFAGHIRNNLVHVRRIAHAETHARNNLPVLSTEHRNYDGPEGSSVLRTANLSFFTANLSIFYCELVFFTANLSFLLRTCLFFLLRTCLFYCELVLFYCELVFFTANLSFLLRTCLFHCELVFFTANLSFLLRTCLFYCEPVFFTANLSFLLRTCLFYCELFSLLLYTSSSL